ncbi:alpha/beta fold hydrolase [Rhizobium rhizogenes]|uniref:alpha/beta fold hydrolase n=1 Tax=Rhizobium rhizogenes TaxID=359 RepID=UPI0009B897FB|nr:alpha/beta hydrolase [Rhizobium rhizogenes]MDJ1638636.1 alpha/beta hydrolase [Rhizobium rhizogenes]NTG77822.1 alpha/beta hydrolase [Rhizobium rhizogenes]
MSIAQTLSAEGKRREAPPRRRTRVFGLLRGVLALAMACTAAILPAAGQAANEPTGVHNIVLVHGAFADGSSWSDIIPLLQAKGFRVTAVQNPLTSLADDVAAARRVLERQKGGVLLVGHSWAGAVVTEAGSAENVKGIVYLSALVPDAGESVSELLQKRNSPMEGLVPDHDGLVWLSDPKAYAHVMASDVSADRVAMLAAVQLPMAANAFNDKISTAAWRTKKSWYLVTEGDNALPTAVQQWLAKHIGATTKTIKSSHMSMISHPSVVADFIANAARSTPE